MVKYQYHIVIGYDKASYVNRGACLESLPPLGKFSASLGKGWVKVHGDQWNGMASCKSCKSCTMKGK